MQEYLAETDAIEKCKERMRLSAMQIRWVEFINFCMENTFFKDTEPPRKIVQCLKVLNILLKLNAKETWEDLVKILPTEGTKLRMQDFNFYAVPDEEEMEKLEVIMTDQFYPELMVTQPTRLAC